MTLKKFKTKSMFITFLFLIFVFRNKIGNSVQSLFCRQPMRTPTNESEAGLMLRPISVDQFGAWRQNMLTSTQIGEAVS